MSLATLPQDVLFLIFRRLDMADLYTLACGCASLHGDVAAFLAQITAVQLSAYPMITLKTLRSLLGRCDALEELDCSLMVRAGLLPRALREARVDATRLRALSFVSSRVLDMTVVRLVEMCPRLTHLHLSHTRVTAVAITAISTHLPDLVDLRIEVAANVLPAAFPNALTKLECVHLPHHVSGEAFALLLRNNPQLHVLRIHALGGGAWAHVGEHLELHELQLMHTPCPQHWLVRMLHAHHGTLRSLALHGESAYCEGIVEYVAAASQLRELSMHSLRVEAAAMSRISAGLRGALTTLKLSGTRVVSSRALGDLVAGGNVRCVTLSSLPPVNLSTSTLALYADQFAHVTSMNLSYVAAINDAGLIALARCVRGLRELTFSGMHGSSVSDAGINVLLRANPRLLSLKLSALSRATDALWKGVVSGRRASLVSCTLWGCPKFGAGTADALVALGGTAMRVLSLSGLRCSADDVARIVAACSQLTSFEVARMRNVVTADTLALLPDTLRVLVLRTQHTLTNGDLIDLLARCVRIHRLTAHGQGLSLDRSMEMAYPLVDVSLFPVAAVLSPTTE